MDGDLQAGPSGANNSFDGADRLRKVRIHKAPKGAAASKGQEPNAAAEQRSAELMERRIAELIPGVAEVAVSGSSGRGQGSSSNDAKRSQLTELASIFDMSVNNPVDDERPSQWSQTLRPQPKKIMLSHYQHEMINYQRMLLRKNVWYYRDRMNNARGPCPLHTLKDCWVQGVIDENTLVWGQGLFDWLPAKNVKLLLPMIRTPEVRFGAWMKRTFSLKPALNKIREVHRDARDPAQQSKQVDWMR